MNADPLTRLLTGQVTGAEHPLPGPQEAQVCVVDDAGVHVTIAAFGPNFRFGPVRASWPQPGPPPVGTGCLVVFAGDDLERPWVIAWANAPTVPMDLPGADLADTRFVGATPTGPPATGIYDQGDLVVAADGVVWVCQVGGAPGQWSSTQRRPTGVLEAVLVPDPAQLVLVGQTVAVSDYPDLYQWASSNGLTGPGQPFTVATADSNPMFTVPDLSGRVFIGATAALPAGTLIPAVSITYTASTDPAAPTAQVASPALAVAWAIWT